MRCVEKGLSRSEGPLEQLENEPIGSECSASYAGSTVRCNDVVPLVKRNGPVGEMLISPETKTVISNSPGSVVVRVHDAEVGPAVQLTSGNRSTREVETSMLSYRMVECRSSLMLSEYCGIPADPPSAVMVTVSPTSTWSCETDAFTVRVGRDGPVVGVGTVVGVAKAGVAVGSVTVAVGSVDLHPANTRKAAETVPAMTKDLRTLSCRIRPLNVRFFGG